MNAYQRDARMNIAVNQGQPRLVVYSMNENEPFHDKTCLLEF